MSGKTCPPSVETRPPSWSYGSGGWDTHAHVFGPIRTFPFDVHRRYTPPEQTVEQYLANLDALGLRMGVLVQPSVYGKDNDALISALLAGKGRLVGVIDFDANTVTDEQIDSWNSAGVCGARVWWDGSLPAQWLTQLASRLRDTRWHLDVFCANADALIDFSARIDKLDMPVMIEAMGTPRDDDTLSSPGFQTLLGLLREEAIWVKLSHPYKIDPGGLPYPLAAPFARAIVDAAPNQVVWGSDWPHPMINGPMPNDGGLIDLLPSWAGSVELARQILEVNPRQFYRQET
ncbi:MAG: amidohydrolase family protein [Pseudomonadota bacterium]